jgi:hypothetical protein
MKNVKLFWNFWKLKLKSNSNSCLANLKKMDRLEYKIMIQENKQRSPLQIGSITIFSAPPPQLDYLSMRLRAQSNLFVHHNLHYFSKRLSLTLIASARRSISEAFTLQNKLFQSVAPSAERIIFKRRAME